MKRSLSAERTQTWALVQMRPMHRAILRRTAQRAMRDRRPPSDDVQGELQIQWQVVDRWEDVRSEVCVIVADIRELLQPAVALNSWSFCFDRYGIRSRPIRLIWNWSMRGLRDLAWCTELGWHGLIHDIDSLEAWLPVCIERGPVQTVQTNSLLADIELPSFQAN